MIFRSGVIGLILSIAVSIAGCAGSSDATPADGAPESSSTASQDSSPSNESDEGAPEERLREVCLGLRAALAGTADEFMNDPGKSNVNAVGELVRADPAAEPLVGIVKDMQELGSWLKEKHSADITDLLVFYTLQGLDPGDALEATKKVVEPPLKTSLTAYVKDASERHGSPPISLSSIRTDLDFRCP